MNKTSNEYQICVMLANKQKEVHKFSLSMQLFKNEIDFLFEESKKKSKELFSSYKSLYLRKLYQLFEENNVDFNECYFNLNVNVKHQIDKPLPINILDIIDKNKKQNNMLNFISLSLIPSNYQFFLTGEAFEHFVKKYKNCNDDIKKKTMLLSFIVHPKMLRYIHVTFGLPIISYICSSIDYKAMTKIFDNNIKAKLPPFDISFIGIPKIIRFILDFNNNTHLFNLKFFSMIPYYMNINPDILNNIVKALKQIDSSATCKKEREKGDDVFIEPTRTFVYSNIDIKVANNEEKPNFCDKPEFVIFQSMQKSIFKDVDYSKNYLFRLLDLLEEFPQISPTHDINVRDFIHFTASTITSIDKRFEIYALLDKIENIEESIRKFKLPFYDAASTQSMRQEFTILQKETSAMAPIIRYANEESCFLLWKRKEKVCKDKLPEIPSSDEIVKSPQLLKQSFIKIKDFMNIETEGSTCIALIRIAATNLTFDNFIKSEKSCTNFDTMLKTWFKSPEANNYFRRLFPCEDIKFPDDKRIIKTAFSASDPFLIVHLFFKSKEEIKNINEKYDNFEENWMKLMARLITIVAPEKTYSVFGYVSTFLKQFHGDLKTDTRDELYMFEKFSHFFFEKVFGDFLRVYNRIVKD